MCEVSCRSSECTVLDDALTRARTILHVDMDAFFASVEQRDHPEWRGKPVIVGAGPQERGVVSTCSYEARRFGVHSAMPSRTAYAHCPEGIFVVPRMHAYQVVSEAAFEVFSHYSPIVEQVSIDEAFLDITGTVALFGSAKVLGQRLRDEVREKLQLTCSVGIGPNRLLAKIASEEDKPDGLYEMPTEAEAIRQWLAPRPASILWGVGKKTAALLAYYGYRTCGDLQRADVRFLHRVLGTAAAQSVLAHAQGMDDTPVDANSAAEKSVSREYTFPQDASDRSYVRTILMGLVNEVGRRFRTEKRWAHTAKVKFRMIDFETVTHQLPFAWAACDDMSFRQAAIRLFNELWPIGASRSLRLIGFGVTNITDAPDVEEPSLFGDGATSKRLRFERLAHALDACQGKVVNASSLLNERENMGQETGYDPATLRSTI